MENRRNSPCFLESVVLEPTASVRTKSWDLAGFEPFDWRPGAAGLLNRSEISLVSVAAVVEIVESVESVVARW